MNYADDVKMQMELRKPFPPEQIGKLPATQKRPALDYIGHAAVTDRLNHAAPDWTYTIEPIVVVGNVLVEDRKARFEPDPNGLPHVVGVFGSMTVGGVMRQEVGEVDSFTTYGRELKEAISDFIRRAAMRFGVALDLWTKEDLQASVEPGGHGLDDGTTEAGDLEPGAFPAGGSASTGMGEPAPVEEPEAGSGGEAHGAAVSEAGEERTDDEGAAAPVDPPSPASPSEPRALSSQVKQLLRHAADLRWNDADIAAAVDEAYPGITEVGELSQEQARALIPEWAKLVKATRITTEQRDKLKALASTADAVRRAQVLFDADFIRNLSDLTLAEAAALISDLEGLREEQREAS